MMLTMIVIMVMERTLPGIIAEGTKELVNVKILTFKVLNFKGKGFILWLRESIKYAVDQKVDIMNLSMD